MASNLNKSATIFGYFVFLLSKLRTALALLAMLLWLAITLVLAFFEPTHDPQAIKPDITSTKYWHEGWWRDDSTPYLMNISFVGDKRGWAVGTEGTILTTDNSGNNWIAQSSPTDNSLNSVYFANAKRGWAVGADGTILTTDDSGNNWIAQSSPTEYWLYSVYFTNEKRGWAVGADGTILTTDDSGNNWIAQSSPTDKSLKSVYFVNEKRGWAVGTDGTILTTGDSGDNWIAQSSPTEYWLYSVYFTNEKRGWAVGTDGTILTTGDSGDNWIAQSSPTDKSLYSVYFTNAKRGWAVGADGTILTTDDSGNNWIAQSSPTEYWLYSVYFANAKRGWAVGADGTILTTDDGTSWQVNKIHVADKKFTDSYVLFSAIAAVIFVFGLLGVQTPAPNDAISGLLSSDRPRSGGESDALNTKALAWALSRFLRHQRTQPPLTIALNAPWGGGKSSLMNWLREDLTRFGFRPAWFNAWHYEKQEQMFPALLETIRQQAVPPWFSWSGLGFRYRLLKHRAKANPMLTIALLISACFPIGYISANPSVMLNKISTHIEASLEQSFPKYISVLNKPQQNEEAKSNQSPSTRNEQKEKNRDEDKLVWLLGLFPGLAPLLGLWKGLQSFSNPGDWLGHWFNPTDQSKATRETAYRAQFAVDFNAVTAALDKTLVIFIDDLDRCQPKSVCEVMETINFLACEGSCHIILGVWREGVERSIGLGFADAAKEFADIGKLKIGENNLDEAEIRRRYGQLYLEKLVNIWVSVPSLDKNAASKLLKRDVDIETITANVRAEQDESYFCRLKTRCQQYTNSWCELLTASVKKFKFSNIWRELNLIKLGTKVWRFLFRIAWLEFLGICFLFFVFIYQHEHPIFKWFYSFAEHLENASIFVLMLIIGGVIEFCFWGLRRTIGRRLPDTPPTNTWMIGVLIIVTVVLAGQWVFHFGNAWPAKPIVENQELTPATSSQNAETPHPRSSPTDRKTSSEIANKPQNNAHLMVTSKLDFAELRWHGLAAIVITFIIWIEWLKYRLELPIDSAAFEEALQFWSPVLCKRFNTPRRLKRFMNHLRFNAMRLRTLDKPDRTRSEQFWNRYIRGESPDPDLIREDEIQGKESGLLLLSVLEACCGSDFGTKSMLVKSDAESQKSFQPEWEKSLKIDPQLVAENGQNWEASLKAILVERLQYFEKNTMPQPAMADLLEFEDLIPARITPASVRDAGLAEQYEWDGKHDRRKRPEQRANANENNVTADRRTGFDRRKNGQQI